MKVLVLPGDGIGPEIVAPTIAVLDAADQAFGLGIEVETADIGLASLAATGTTLPPAVLSRVPEVDGVILGPVSHYDYPPREQGGRNPSAELRVGFELFANIRPCRSSAFSIRKVTAKGSARIARAAFELATRRRRRVTAVHKANVLKLSDALFLREVRKVAGEFPDVRLDELIVDAAAAALIRRPDEFDVIVTTNMFGDILSDEAAELCGSLGLGGSLNAGSGIAVAQAQHGSAPDIAGQGIANPTSLILSTAMLLDWRGRRDGDEDLVTAAAAIGDAVSSTLDDPASRTRDLGGDLGTAQYADRVVARLSAAH
jgi:3-isopropylmalate dehydrogenase